MDRKTEVRELLKLSVEEVIKKADEKLVVCEDISTLHRHFAEDIASTICNNNAIGKSTRLILPVGPTGQYPILAEIINEKKLDLSNCWIFFMDEHCDENKSVLKKEHPLSFKGIAENLFFKNLDKSCAINPDRFIFPDENNITDIGQMIKNIGGIDICYGGIGIHGHMAYNEPESGVKISMPRCVKLNDFTVTINAIRSEIGGNIECFPRYAYTLGVQQILSARKIRLYCRNGCKLDWANAVLRLALFGEPGDDYPVTYIREHDFVIVTDKQTLTSPKYFI